MSPDEHLRQQLHSAGWLADEYYHNGKRPAFSCYDRLLAVFIGDKARTTHVGRWRHITVTREMVTDGEALHTVLEALCPK